MNNRIKKDKFSQYKPDIFYRDPTRVPTIFSDKDLKVNFKNFPKYKKILVTGQSGSGKTTVSKKLAKAQFKLLILKAKPIHITNLFIYLIFVLKIII